MNGIHDMGGMHGFGPVVVEEDEPVFHAPWEGRIFGLRALARRQGMTVLDAGRHAVERIDPADYLTLGYYGRWLRSFETELVRYGWMGAGELEARLAGDPFDPAPVPPLPAEVDMTARRARESEPRFVVGQRVRTRNHQVPGHTRLPAYARARHGVVAIVHPGEWVLPDTNAHGLGENPEVLYVVRFTGYELWGEQAEPGTSVHLDLFESYLETEGDDER